jgi:hypothetical protein
MPSFTIFIERRGIKLKKDFCNNGDVAGGRLVEICDNRTTYIIK